MIADARLVIADEPTPGMSVEQAVEALKIFREMAEEGKSIVLITHDIDLAFAFADRIAVFMLERLWRLPVRRISGRAVRASASLQ